MTPDMAQTKLFAVISYHQAGRTYYVARDASRVTCRKNEVWTTTSRQDAAAMAVAVRGSVAEVTP